MGLYTKKQIADLVNEVIKESTGTEGIVKEDLSNVVDQGRSVLGTPTMPIVAQNMVCRIGKDVYRIQNYTGRAPSVYMDAWEYGAIKMKVSFGLYKAEENATWKYENGASIDPFQIHEPNAKAKYFDKSTTFEVPVTLSEELMKNAFTSAEAMQGFVEGIFQYVRNSITLATDELVMRTINNMIGLCIGNGHGVNVLSAYNAEHTDAPLTASTCFKNPDFCRFFYAMLGIDMDRMNVFSTTFNIDGEEKYTPAEDLRLVMLSDVSRYFDAYLNKGEGQFKEINLPNADKVAFWQASGTSWGDKDKIHCILSDGTEFEQSGVMALMFDRNALGVSCQNDRVPTQWNGRGEYTNYFFKRDANYWVDTAENAIAYYVEDEDDVEG